IFRAPFFFCTKRFLHDIYAQFVQISLTCLPTFYRNVCISCGSLPRAESRFYACQPLLQRFPRAAQFSNETFPHFSRNASYANGAAMPSDLTGDFDIVVEFTLPAANRILAAMHSANRFPHSSTLRINDNHRPNFNQRLKDAATAVSIIGTLT